MESEENGKPVQVSTIQGHAGRIWNVAWSPDGSGNLRTWDAATHSLQATWKGSRAGNATVLAVHPTLNLAATSASNHKSVQLVDMNTKKVIPQKVPFQVV